MIATPCAICSKLGGYDVAGGFCSGQECLFRPIYGDRDYLVGVATFNGYYTRVEKFGFGQQSAVCDSFVVVRGPSELIRLTLAQVDRGNSLNSKNAANQPVVSIDLGALTTLEANQIRASTARDPVALVVVAHGLLRPGPPLCYSQYDIVRVSGATTGPNGQTALPTPKPPAISQPLDFAFVDSRNGWLLGAASGQTVLYKTADGGETWRPLNVPLARPSFFDSERWSLSDQPMIGQIRFMNNQDGWLYGSSMFATHDAGQTWTDAHRVVGALELGGEAAWAIEQASGRMVVLRSIDAGRTWTPTSAQPDLKSAPSLAVFDAKTAWILNSDPLVMRSGLLATSDGGMTWREKALPFDGCPSPFVIVDGDRRLWFVWRDSGDGPAGKSVYVSDDGGIRGVAGQHRMAGPRAAPMQWPVTSQVRAFRRSSSRAPFGAGARNAHGLV
jgi:hypothetical protein